MSFVKSGCTLVTVFLSLFRHGASIQGGMLFPRESESRQMQELNGMWNFRADRSASRDQGLKKSWYMQNLAKTGPVLQMPVPSSYNDITTDKSLRDFVGWVWYDRQFYVSPDWKNRRVLLRLDSAHYYSMVWVNGKPVMEHNGGHLPFEAKVNEHLNFAGANRVTVSVNNTLTPHTLPCGSIQYMSDTKRYPPGYFVQNLQFDFFNYAGIHRNVRLYTTPSTYIDDITVTTGINGSDGVVHYTVQGGGVGTSAAQVAVLDQDGQEVGVNSGLTGSINVKAAKLWWPYTMSENYGYRYTLQVSLKSNESSTDIYRLPFGIRTIRVTPTQLLINAKPFYCHGVAKHEDSDIRGKGLDFALIARDFNMLKWLGANCFRTSHYPYAEEILEEADRQGIVIIDECPAVGLKSDENLSNQTLAHHLEVMEELVRRDKNKPSVILWSVANEPSSDKEQADYYFRTVIRHTKQLDPDRPVTFVAAVSYSSDRAGQYTDVQCINRYFGWYSDTGHTEVIHYQMGDDLQNWYNKLHKPLMVAEYGADTVAGLHDSPSFVFTEEYQSEFMKEYHAVFDQFKSKFLVGEMVWNFADFMTDESVTRVLGNRKGVLTRQRQPKMAAHQLRQRYWRLINETLPCSKIPI